MRRSAAIPIFLIFTSAVFGQTTKRRAVRFHAPASNVIVSIATTGRSLPKGFSGVNYAPPENALRYTDPQAANLLAAVGAGWVRFPGGTVGNAHNWETGDMAQTVVPFPYSAPSQWICSVEEGVLPNGNLNGPCVSGSYQSFLESAEQANMGKGYTKFSDFRTFARGVGVIITANAFTDSVTHIAALAKTACSATTGVNVVTFELANEAYLYPGKWPRGSTYLSDMQAYRSAIAANCPNVPVALFYAGKYSGGPPVTPGWDNDLFNGTANWNDVATHVYPQFTSANCGNDCAGQAAAFYNGFLANDTNAYLDSYFVARKPNAAIEISEFNFGGGDGRTLLQQTIYEPIFLAEFIARVSSDPNVRYVGVHQLYQPGGGSGSMMIAANDHLQEVQAAAKSTTGPINTTGFTFLFGMSVAGRGLSLVNGVVNANDTALMTTIRSGPLGAATVPASATDPSVAVPAVFAQAYTTSLISGRSILITNKSDQPQVVELVDGGTDVMSPLLVWTFSGTRVDDRQPVYTPPAGTVTNPITVPPFSVVRVQY